MWKKIFFLTCDGFFREEKKWSVNKTVTASWKQQGKLRKWYQPKVKYVEIGGMCYVELSPDIYVFLRRRYDFRQILTSQHSSANQSATLSRKSTEWLTEISWVKFPTWIFIFGPYGWLSAVGFNDKSGYKPCDHYKFECSHWLKYSLQSECSTNERNQNYNRSHCL